MVLSRSVTDSPRPVCSIGEVDSLVGSDIHSGVRTRPISRTPKRPRRGTSDTTYPILHKEIQGSGYTTGGSHLSHEGVVFRLSSDRLDECGRGAVGGRVGVGSWGPGKQNA